MNGRRILALSLTAAILAATESTGRAPPTVQPIGPPPDDDETIARGQRVRHLAGEAAQALALESRGREVEASGPPTIGREILQHARAMTDADKRREAKAAKRAAADAKRKAGLRGRS